MKNLIRFDQALKRLLRNKANYKVLEGFISELLNEEYSIRKAERNNICHCCKDESLLNNSKITNYEKNVVLDEYRIMPNHFHDNKQIHNLLSPEQYIRIGFSHTYRNKFGPRRNNLPSIIGGFKSSVKTKIKFQNTALAISLYRPVQWCNNEAKGSHAREVPSTVSAYFYNRTETTKNL